MKKITCFLASLFVLSATNLFAVSLGTTWWNGETFEGYTAGTDFKAAGATAWSGWTTSYFVQSQSITASTTASATGNVLGFATTNITALGEVSQGGTRTFTKSNFTTLTGGYVYGKTSFYTATGGNSIGTNYTLKNSTGGIVFEFGGMGTTTNNLWITGVPAATMLLGARTKWNDIEFVLDLTGNKAKKVIVTYNGTSKTYTDLTLAAGGNINTLLVTEAKGFDAGGLDNTTLGQLSADNIKTLTSSQTSHQTLDATTVNTTFGLTSFTTAMSQDFAIAKTDLDVKWRVSNWGSLGAADTSKIVLTRGASDFTTATLTTTSSISTNDSITISAAYGATTLTKRIAVKGADIAGVKATLAAEISTATSLRDAVTASNPYISSAKSTLTTAISTAQTVHDTSSSPGDVGTAVTTLQTAETSFTSAMTPYNTYVSYIATVTAGRDAEVRTAPFFTAIKSTLNTAISIATSAKDTVTIATGIAAAQATLQAAYTQFNTDKPAYDNLSTQITTVTNRKNTVDPRKGDTRFLMFPTANVATLVSDIATAQTVLDNGTTATDLNTANTTLATALTTFNALDRVHPSTNYYRIYTNGVDNGDGNTDKKVLFAHATTSLKYASMSNATILALGDSALWTITVGSTNTKYVVQNKATGYYLSGTGLSATSAEFTFPENTSQTNLIKYGTDSYFVYSIVNGSSKGLEIDAYDAASKTGSFLINSASANRFRFCYQFEEAVAQSLSTSGSLTDFTTNAFETATQTLSLTGADLFGDITLSLTGVNASKFSVSPTSINTTNTLLGATTVTINYSPISTRVDYDLATLSIAASDGTTLTYNLQGVCLTTGAKSLTGSFCAYAVNRNLIVNGANAYDVYNVQGSKVASVAVSSANAKVSLMPGVYVVKAAGKVQKVLVK